MLELFQLEQLVAFAKYGTLSKAAEELHMSQPTLTRAMQKLESEFDVPLFRRSRNRLEFNETGKLAADYAGKILDQTQDMLSLVRSFDRANRTLSIGACAPMPMLLFVQDATRLYPNMAITSELKKTEMLECGIKDGTYQIIILPYKPEIESACCRECGTESLSFALPMNHPLAGSKGLHMQDLDGENMLLYSDIGFWHELHKQKMPHSRFLVQSERFAFDELVQSSVLPSFISDVIIRLMGKPENRVVVPILDPEASVTYYAVCLKENMKKFHCLF